MKKMFLGVVLGAVAGAVGYKLYKEREDEIKEIGRASCRERV